MDSQFQILIHISMKYKQGQNRYGICYLQGSFILAKIVKSYGCKLEFGTEYLSVHLRAGLS